MDPTLRRKFEAHLSARFTGQTLRDAMQLVADLVREFRSPRRRAAFDDTATRMTADERRDWRAIEKHAAALRSLCRRRSHWVDQLDTAVRLIVQEAQSHNKSRPEGRRSHAWRDHLIATLHGLYTAEPDHTHFVETVRIALDAIDSEVDNVHEVIDGALRRQPTAPRRVENGQIIICLPAVSSRNP